MGLTTTPLPEGWYNRPLGEICQNISLSHHPNPHGVLPYVALEHLEKGFPLLLGHGIESEAQSNKSIFRAGDVLFGKLGTDLKKGAKVDFDGICSTDILVLRGNQECLSDYVELIVHSVPFNRYANSTISGVTHPRTSWKELSEFMISLPSTEEQRRIVDHLNLIRKGVSEQERLIQITTELKEVLRAKCFVDGLNGEPQRKVAFGLIPESWDVVELQDTGDVVYGIQAAVASNVLPIGTPILTNKNITLDGAIVLDKLNYFELRARRHFDTILRRGDLLFNWRSGSKDHVGKTAYFDMEGDWVHSSFILRIRPRPEINGRYLFYYLNHLREIGYFVKLQTYSINAKFNKSAINVLPTAVPSRAEQDEIVQALDSVQDKILNAERKKAALQELFRTLLHELMTGKVRVNDLN